MDSQAFQEVEFYDRTKVLYIFGYFFLLFGGWSFKFFDFLSGDVLLVTQYVYLFWGYNHWADNPYSLLTKSNTFYFKWIIAGIFLSMIPAALYHNQSLFVSITAYRAQYLWFSFFVLLRIAPTEQEIVKACLLNLFVMWTTYLCKLFYPGLFPVPEDIWIPKKDNAYDVGYVPGMTMAIFVLYYYYDKIRDCANRVNVFYFALAFVFLLAMSNRSNLFAAVITIVISAMLVKSQNRSRIIAIVLLGAVVSFFVLDSYWSSLLDETTNQVNNDDYNRNKALYYYLYEGSENFLTKILGNGFLSSRSSRVMADLMDMGIYNSDMGFVGFWNQFGIIPVIIFIMMPILAIKNKVMPLYVKMIGSHILLCSYSISYYGATSHAIIFILFYYLYIFHKCMHF